jgi:hypothetical protein
MKDSVNKETTVVLKVHKHEMIDFPCLNAVSHSFKLVQNRKGSGRNGYITFCALVLMVDVREVGYEDGTGSAEKDKRVGRNGIIYLLGLALVCALVLMVDA